MKTTERINQYNTYQGLVSYAAYVIALYTLFLSISATLPSIPFIISTFLISLLLCTMLIRKSYAPQYHPLSFILISLLFTLLGFVLLGIDFRNPPIVHQTYAGYYNIIALTFFIALPALVAGFRFRQLSKLPNELHTPETEQQMYIAYGVKLTAINIAIYAFLLGLCKWLSYNILQNPIFNGIAIFVLSAALMLLLILHLKSNRIFRLHPLLYILICCILILCGSFLFAISYIPSELYPILHVKINFFVRILLPFAYLFILLMGMRVSQKKLIVEQKNEIH